MINKIVISRGALFDYESIVCLVPMNVVLIKEEIEKLLNQKKYFFGNDDLRMPYFDKTTDNQLLLFLKKGYRFGLMQIYILQGVCLESDYDKEMENNGVIKEWLEVEI